MNESLHHRLNELHAQNQPNSEFADRLEAELRTASELRPSLAELSPKARVVRSPREYGRLVAIAASLVIVIGLFVAVPPLRSFVEELMGYFVTGSYTPPTEEDLASAPPEVSSIAEAEVITDFDVLEWVEEGYEVVYISASKTSVSLGYVKQTYPGYRGLIMLTESITETGAETEPVGSTAYVETVTVSGVQGEYLQGMWFSEEKDGEAKWNPDDYRQLRWQKGTITYRLIVSTKIADLPTEVIAIAEALK